MALQAVTLDSTGGRDISPSVTLLSMMSPPIQDSLEKLSSLSYFKNGASLPNVVPGTAGRTHGVASSDLGLGMVSHNLGLNRRERCQSFSNAAINDVTPYMGFLRKIAIIVILQEWRLPP
jgi:hypothetical protein